MSRTRVICPCGVQVSLPSIYHRKPGNGLLEQASHECIHHDQTRCRTCITLGQVGAYLMVAADLGRVEAERIFREETDGKRSRGIWE